MSLKILLKIMVIGLIFFLLIIMLPRCIMMFTPVKKPVIYLYPEKEQQISVKLDYQGKLTCTYPYYNDGWNVIAKPDGTLVNLEDNQQYSYLYWEGIPDKPHWDMTKGFVVKGEDTREFLQDVLSRMGMIPREYNEFIVYWLPIMEKNKYNLIHFSGADYEKSAPLEISPQPDNILRVFMAFKPLSKPVKVEAQNIKSFERKGFVVVEWGGSQVR